MHQLYFEDICAGELIEFTLQSKWKSLTAHEMKTHELLQIHKMNAPINLIFKVVVISIYRLLV